MNRYMSLLAILVLLCGCNVKTGEELMRAPEMTQDQEEISKAIRSQLDPNAQLVTPLGGVNKSALQFADLDGDGQEEVAVFYKLESQGQQVMCKVLQKNGQDWKTYTEIKGNGNEVDQVYFADLVGDGKYEMIVGWQLFNQSTKGLSVYKFSKGSNEIFSTTYDQVTLSDIDDDETDEIILIQSGKDTAANRVIFYKYQQGKIQNLYEAELEYPISRYVGLSVGNASSGGKGLFLDYISENNTLTELLIIGQDGQLRRVFTEEEKVAYTARQTKEKCSDIDGDGIIEIPSTKEAGMQEKSLPLQPILTWSKWDGNSGVVFTTKSYTDDEGGFSLVFPSALNNQEVYVDVSVEAGLHSTIFYEAGTSEYLFSISACYPKDTDQHKSENTVILAEKGNLTYLLDLGPSCPVDSQEIEKNFRLIS